MGLRFLNQYFIAGCVALVMAGCGGDDRPATFPVNGKVTLDGKPVEDATVTFVGEPAENSAATKTKADGTYELATFEAGDGARPGSYKIMVTKIAAEEGGPSPYGAAPEGAAPVEQSPEAISDAYSKAFTGPPKKGTKAPKVGNELPMKYASVLTSGLTFKVEEKPNTFDIQLKSK